MKTINLTKRIQFRRGVTWGQFGEAWTTAPPKTQDKRLNALRFFGVLVVW